MSDKHDSNRLAWNEAAATYRADLEKSIQLLREGKNSFCAPELETLKRVVPGTERCIHLQCAGGSDSLSLLNLGAKEVIGVDISEEMIAVAREKALALKMNAKWVVSDTLKVPSELDATADLIYTGQGAINWIMDIQAWAHVVARLLKTNGSFYLFEGHPLSYLFKMEAHELEIDPDFGGYFSEKIYESKDWPTTYVGKLKDSVDEQANKFERAWPVSTVINALLEAGLSLQHFGEYPDEYWKEFPNMPAEIRRKFPNTFSLLMKKLGR